MMRRRAMARRGPGIVGTVARTAVVAGTATVVAGGVSGAMQNRAAAQQHEAQAQQAAIESQAEVAELQQQMSAMQAQQTQAAMAAPAQSDGPDMMAQLQQLAQMRDAGVLTEEEFSAAKAKLLGS